MKRDLDILFEVTGQSLYWDAPEGRASSVVSSEVFPVTSGDDDTAESATTGSAAVETNPNTTFDATSGAGQTNPRKCNLTATTGIAVGRRYLATNATGEREWVEVTEIASADYVIARYALANSYASADSFVSTRITHAIDSTWVAAEENLTDRTDPNPGWRWRLVYVVGGVTYAHDIYFDLVRYPGVTAVSGVDVDRLSPGFLDWLPTNYREDQGQALIAEAYDEVSDDLMAAGVADQQLKSKVRDRLVRRKTLVLVAKAHFMAGGDGAEKLELAERDYSALLERLVTVTARANQGTDDSGAAHAVNAGNIWRR